MKYYSKQARLTIYKRMLDFAIEDRNVSLRGHHDLHGLCYILKRVTNFSAKITDFRELCSLKPKNKSNGNFWWSRKATNMTRINKLKEIIKKMESK